ncbi:glycosyltransferase family 1 protein [Spirochaetia bacterium 38H-sp]|uniref:Glycosyltransferase family 1 protein n=1 Tax=Rarispira pelagica TaxID=3141764 RepID=A0ABU9U9Y9_9SPIR
MRNYEKIKLLFDISRFGSVWIDGSKKDIRGIYRVVLELAKNLSKEESLDLAFTSLSDKKICGASQIYHKKSDLRDISFVPPSLSYSQYILARFAQIYKKYTKLQSKLQFKRILNIHSTSKTTHQYSGIEIKNPSMLNYDIIHLPFFVKTNIKEIPFRTLITIHDLIPILYPTPEHIELTQFIEAKLKELTPRHWIHCISESTRKDLLKLNLDIDPQKVFVVPNGVSDFFYKIDKENAKKILDKYNITNDYIITLSTIQKRKNIENAIKAFHNIHSNYPDLKYIIVGYFSDSYLQVKELINKYKLNNHIILLGHIPDEDIRALYSMARIFLFTSFYEGFGLPPLEAMACGLPVVASNTSSIPEVVGESGLLIDPNDVSDIANKLNIILKDSKLCKKLSQKSLEQSRKFTWQNTTHKLTEYYTKMIEQDS